MEAVLDFLVPMLQSAIVKYPKVMIFVSIMGTFRMVFKPLVTFAHAYVAATPSTSDDLKLEKVEASKPFRAIKFLVDYFTSIKVK